MPIKKKKPNPTAASGTGTARTLSIILRRVTALETVQEVAELYMGLDDINDYQRMLVADVVGLYPWAVDVANSIMSYGSRGSDEELVDFLRSSPDEVYVVKDTQRAGQDALWLAGCHQSKRSHFMRAIDGVPCRGIFHHVPGGDIITAIQLSSCQL